MTKWKINTEGKNLRLTILFNGSEENSLLFYEWTPELFEGLKDQIDIEEENS